MFDWRMRRPFVLLGDFVFNVSAQDNGEGRRLGTLVVWLDDGIATDEPLLAVPINLSVLLDLPQDQVLTVHPEDFEQTFCTPLFLRSIACKITSF